MSTTTPTPTPQPRPGQPYASGVSEEHLTHRWATALGILLIVAGLLAIVFPLIASLTTAIFVGWLLIIAGIGQLAHALSAREWGGSLWYALVGVVLVVGGGLIVFDPLAGTVTLTVVLAAVFLVEGVIEIVAALSMRPVPNWGWHLASGIAALIAGAMIALQLPFSALWAIGFITGINFIFSGAAFLTDGGGMVAGNAASRQSPT